MRFKLIIVMLIAAAFAIYALTVFSEDQTETPKLLKGKIWGGSDTLNLGKKSAPDSLLSYPGDSAASEEPIKTDEDSSLFSEGVIELREKMVSKNAKLLKLKLSLPRNLKFIKDAPIILVVKSSNPEIIEIGEVVSEDPEKGFAFPISAHPGMADLYLYYRIVCCTTGQREICYYKEAKLKVPVRAGDFEETVLVIRHEIEN